MTEPILQLESMTHEYPGGLGCRAVDLAIHPGEIIAIVGESGAGKSTLLDCASGRLAPTGGRVLLRRDEQLLDLYTISSDERQALLRSCLARIHQNPRDGIRFGISAGGNVAEPLLAAGERHYGAVREQALEWLERVEIDRARADDPPEQFSGGMQQRVQIARALVTRPAVLLADEPTGGLDVSVQATLIELLRKLVRDHQIAMVVVTHDLAVARYLASRMLVMRAGRVVEAGLTDQVLHDPQHPYSQSLVASVLRG
ncbi:MAG: phosphonate C-P lyase system protein PhnK [Halofilum sp. (in: g-proteobacteria)]